MPQVYLVARREEVQNGSVMVTDLSPNESQRNASIDPPASGPIYVRQIDLGTRGSFRAQLSTNAGVVSFARDSKGLVPYLLNNIQVGNAGPALTLAQAREIAGLIISEVRTGGTLGLVELNNIIGGVAVGATLTANLSTGSVANVLRVLAGETYLVTTGSVVEEAGAFIPDVNTDARFQNDVRHPVNGDSSWAVSAEEGTLAGLSSAQDADKGFAGVLTADPIVTIYNADGSLFA